MDARERIVVIDDNANDLQVTRRFLERKGYEVTAVTSGDEGLEVAGRITPDAFVVDYRMPEMDGFEVTRRIKSDPQLKTIPVLMLTGADAPHTIAATTKARPDPVRRRRSASQSSDAPAVN